MLQLYTLVTLSTQLLFGVIYNDYSYSYYMQYNQLGAGSTPRICFRIEGKDWVLGESSRTLDGMKVMSLATAAFIRLY